MTPVASFLTVHWSPSSSTILPNRIPLAYMFGIPIKYSPSSGLPRSRTCDAPSIMVAAELPRNLLLGLSSPLMSIPFSGEVKYHAEIGGWCETCSAT